ncbi:MAG TPA: ferrochelatase [Streptosporangiaceae bacterium]|nr:ferrochelatase [Streptosporangiaceae bacterium]
MSAYLPGEPGYDAFLLVSFGGPEGPADVLPFLENVTRGRGIPGARLAEVAEHYQLFGGVSPINEQCRDLIVVIEASFAAGGIDLPVYWGNRNWRPYLPDTVRQLARAGVRRAIAFVTSAYSSYSSCRQYLEDMERARELAGPTAPRIDKLRPYFNHPGFIEPLAQHTRAALATLPAAVRENAHLLFSAHSVPTAMAATSGPRGGAYVAELTEVARLVSERVDGGSHPWRLVYQSRSGPPSQPWLEPDVGDYLAEIAGRGAPAAVLVPAGFVTDHMEVKYDLDVAAADAAVRLGITVARADTPSTHPRFAEMVRELVAERLDDDPERLALGTLGPSADCCPAGCCAYTRPRGRPAAHASGHGQGR